MEKYKGLNKEELNQAFFEACARGHLEVVKYLLGSSGAWSLQDKGCGVRLACQNGHLEVVRCLLTSPELKNNVNTLANDLGGGQFSLW